MGLRPGRRGGAPSTSCAAGGARAGAVSVDLADAQAPAGLVASACDAFGRLDILVANHARSSEQDLEQLTAAEIDLTYAVNTRATLLLAQEFAARHDGRPGGGSSSSPRGSTTGRCRTSCRTSPRRGPCTS